MLTNDILLLIISIPLIGAICISLIDKKNFENNVRRSSQWTAAFTFAMSLWLFTADSEKSSILASSQNSVCLVVMTTFLMLISVIISQNEIKAELKKKFYILIFALEALFVALFSTADILVFYILLELIMLLTFILLGGFASNSIYAVKFLIILFVGMFFLLCGVIYLISVAEASEVTTLINYAFNFKQECIIFSTLFIGFAGLALQFPLHVWLPEAHAASPTSVQIIISVILPKIGAFGLLTILLPIADGICRSLSTYVLWIGALTTGYATMAALIQKVARHTAAYSSIAYAGLLVIGIFSGGDIGRTGAFFHMISHSLVLTMLLVVISIVENRFKQLKQQEGNISITLQSIPYLLNFALVPMLSLSSIPLLPCFVGNFLILCGCWKNHPSLCFIICFLLAAGGSHAIRTYQRVSQGESNLKKIYLTKAEWFCLASLAVTIFALGIYPRMLITPTDQRIERKQ
ncbi:MAG: hypothetical protein LBS14_00995 [Holosporaceae bacterium]|jgi:NADH-quinone oxidoreductase subunit M|nr:hypothetical protein [Holosporaceae bacterium]